VSRASVAAFAASITVLLIALASPIDALAEALFSAHMVQHLLLMLVAAPLWVLGTPLVPLLWALPAPARRRTGRYWVGSRWLAPSFRALTSGGVALLLNTVAIWVWHFPSPYQLALENPRAHAVEHLTFFGSALLFWWVVLQPAGRRRTSYALALLLVVAALMQGGVLGALLMFANAPWYPVHAAGARAWGVDLLQDQQRAGLIMWIPSAGLYVLAGVWLFLQWMRSEARRDSLGMRQRSFRGVPLASTRSS
jgi:cytochrome c oxidase assembly factor CtaG